MSIPFVISVVEPGQTKVTQLELAPVIKETREHIITLYVHCTCVYIHTQVHFWCAHMCSKILHVCTYVDTYNIKVHCIT